MILAPISNLKKGAKRLLLGSNTVHVCTWQWCQEYSSRRLKSLHSLKQSFTHKQISPPTHTYYIPPASHSIQYFSSIMGFGKCALSTTKTHCKVFYWDVSSIFIKSACLVLFLAAEGPRRLCSYVARRPEVCSTFPSSIFAPPLPSTIQTIPISLLTHALNGFYFAHVLTSAKTSPYRGLRARNGDYACVLVDIIIMTTRITKGAHSLYRTFVNLTQIRVLRAHRKCAMQKSRIYTMASNRK